MSRLAHARTAPFPFDGRESIWRALAIESAVISGIKLPFEKTLLPNAALFVHCCRLLTALLHTRSDTGSRNGVILSTADRIIGISSSRRIVMERVNGLRSDIGYIKDLVGSGLDGITSAKQELGSSVFTPPLKSTVWAPMAVGAVVGALGSRLSGNRKAPSIAIAGLAGSLVGLATALVWSSRSFTDCACRRAARLVNATRDARWLDTHPIDYA
jgi:hypothetical protein